MQLTYPKFVFFNWFLFNSLFSLNKKQGLEISVDVVVDCWVCKAFVNGVHGDRAEEFQRASLKTLELDFDLFADSKTGKHSTKLEKDTLSGGCADNDSRKDIDSLHNNGSYKKDHLNEGLFSDAKTNDDEKVDEDSLLDIQADCEFCEFSENTSAGV